jgi:hypothetical protein
MRVMLNGIHAGGLAAIEATLPDGYFLTLPRDVLDKLNYLRGPGRELERRILRLATAD